MIITSRQQVFTQLRTAFISFAITALTLAVHLQYFRRSSLRVPVNNRIIRSPSAASEGNIAAARPPSSSSGIMTAEFLKDDYRAFIFAIHPLHGILLLHCTRKKNKGPHYQAPGGHIDKEDFDDAMSAITPGGSSNDPAILMQACKIGAARELYEETGMDVRSELDRLQPARLWDIPEASSMNVFKFRLFFKLCLDDGDFASVDGNASSEGLFRPMDNFPPHLMLRLSHEHQGWRFEPDAMKAVDLLIDHSGGKVSNALEMAVGQGEIVIAKGELDTSNVLEKYVKDDYRAFVFAIHPLHGILLLRCTRKKKKGSHFQAPGGHIDKEDFDDAVSNTSGGCNQGPAMLIRACKKGAARELYEETGIDLRSELDRFQSVRLRDDSQDSLVNELKGRIFFKLCLDDDDFARGDNASSKGLCRPINNKPPHLMLRLSHEHQGFVFEPNAMKAVDMLLDHSGGKVSKALEMAIGEGEIEYVNGEVCFTDEVADIVDESKVVGHPIDGGTDEPENKGRLFNCFNCC